MLAAPRRCEILPPALRNKVLACLATQFDVQKSVIKSVIKLDQPIVQYGRVSGLEGSDLMLGHYFVKQTAEDIFCLSESCLLFICAFSEHLFSSIPNW